jgi:lysophospholipase L1-like esterase
MRRATVAAVMVGGLLGPATAAHAGPKSPQRAVVTLGDSYISGEAGRWKGNSTTTSGDSAGTDRAFADGVTDLTKVYLGGSDVNGCHRSDVAEAISATRLGTTAVNLACSGSETVNVLRKASGGTPFKDADTQGDQLVQVAKDFDVEVIVLSIGGNDLGFGDAAQDCVTRYLRGASACHDDAEKQIDDRMSRTMSNVRNVVDDLRRVMKKGGYKRKDYRFILQSYPSPVSRGSENRLGESGWDRVSYGCGMWNSDLDWARDTFVPTVADNLRAVAEAEKVEFLDVRNLLQDHEICSVSAKADGTAADGDLEWARVVSVGVAQGDKQESLHPNALGQAALGACLRKAIADKDGDEWMCRAGAGVAPQDVRLDQIHRKPVEVEPQRSRVFDVAPDPDDWASLDDDDVDDAIERRGGPATPAG